jgi:hypothetical protein
MVLFLIIHVTITIRKMEMGVVRTVKLTLVLLVQETSHRSILNRVAGTSFSMKLTLATVRLLEVLRHSLFIQIWK